MSWNRKHLLDIESLSAPEILTVLDTATAFKAVGERAIKKVPALRGKTVVNLFVEPSTRTRTSFNIWPAASTAAPALGLATLHIAGALTRLIPGVLIDLVVRSLLRFIGYGIKGLIGGFLDGLRPAPLSIAAPAATTPASALRQAMIPGQSR